MTEPGEYSANDYYVSRPGGATREAGFHKQLAKFLRWELPNVATYEDKECPLYLQMIFPFLFVEQKRGWATISPPIPTQWRIREPHRRVVEFLLKLDAYRVAIRRQHLRAERTVGVVSRCKKGDYVVTLGESSGAPGTNIIVEIKNQPLKIKDAIDELQEAKTNREATVGIFVFARGCEPPEVGDFRRIGEDFYCTVDKNDLYDGKSLLFFESAYKIARALIVATARKESAGELDIQKIEDHLDAPPEVRGFIMLFRYQYLTFPLPVPHTVR